MFHSNRSGVTNLYVMNADGSGDDELIVKSENLKIPSDWSSDGQFIVYAEVDPQTKADLWILPITRDRKPILFLRTEFSEHSGKLSPTDKEGHKWMAFVSNESGQDEVYLCPFLLERTGSAARAKLRVSTNGGQFPQWRKDGRELFYMADGKLMAVDVKPGTSIEAGVPHILFTVPSGSNGYAGFGDGRRFLFTPPAGEFPTAKLNVVLNWTAELTQ